MTVEKLGTLATQEVTFTYLDENHQICFWSASVLDLFNYDKCVAAPFQLRQFHEGRGVGEKSDSKVCSLLPIEDGWDGMSLAESQFLQLVYKRFHSTFTIGLSRSSSLNSKDPYTGYASPLPLANQLFGPRKVVRRRVVNDLKISRSMIVPAAQSNSRSIRSRQNCVMILPFLTRSGLRMSPIWWQSFPC